MATLLTAKRQRFCDEYLIDLNATQATIRAGYSPKWADRQATQLLGDTRVQVYIQQRQVALREKTEITQEEVVCTFRELRDEARDAKDFGNALRANENLGKHLGIYAPEEAKQSGELLIRFVNDWREAHN